MDKKYVNEMLGHYITATETVMQCLIPDKPPWQRDNFESYVRTMANAIVYKHGTEVAKMYLKRLQKIVKPEVAHIAKLPLDELLLKC